MNISNRTPIFYGDTTALANRTEPFFCRVQSGR